MASETPALLHPHATSGGIEAVRYAPHRPEDDVLYQTVQAELETFLARAHARERPVPRFVERELRAFLRCGILAYGFVRVHCDECGLDRVVAFSCKGRGFCPSCGGRRMADTAAHLVDRVLPEVPIRQWVLSLPFGLHYQWRCQKHGSEISSGSVATHYGDRFIISSSGVSVLNRRMNEMGARP